MRALALLRAFLRRDWSNETSYRAMILIEVLGVGTSLIMFYSIGKLVSSDPPSLRKYGGEYFPFALIGLAVSSYFSISLIAFSGRLRQAQTTGTLEAMFVTATPPAAVLMLSGIWDFTLATLRLLAFVLVGMLGLGVDFDVNLAALIPLAVLSLVSFIALGLCAASVILVIKRGDSIAMLGNVVASVFGGVLFPITLLPTWVRPISYFVPLAWALDGLRQATLVGAGLDDVTASLLGLTVSAAVLVPAAYIALRWSIEKVRRDGTVGQY